jgi:hypothetical protein
MIVRGITLEDLHAAVEVASEALGNQIVVEDIRPENKRGDAHRFRVKVANSDEPRARVHLLSYYYGHTTKPRRSRYACAHTYGVLFMAIFERNPHASIRTGKAHYRDAWNFLRKYQGVLDSEIGSRACPIRYGDSCTCESDEIDTTTIDGSGVMLGATLPGR